MVTRDSIEKLRGKLRGELLQESDDAYHEARRVWNAMIDRYPALIVRALGAADVSAAVDFAREHKLDISVKGGGHSVGGMAVRDDAVMLDLSQMRSVRIDPEERTARIEPGALLHDLDVEAQAASLDIS